MKKMKKYLGMLFMAMVLLVTTSIVAPEIIGGVTVEAAAIKLSKTKLTLLKGKSTTLKISGTSAKVTWTSNNKKVATVNSKGKIVAKGNGKATISAKVKGKTYKCTVTVVPSVKSAFTAEPYAESSRDLVLGIIFKNKSNQNIYVEDALVVKTNGKSYYMRAINEKAKFINGTTVKAGKTGYLFFAEQDYDYYRINTSSLCGFIIKYLGKEYVVVVDYYGKTIDVSDYNVSARNSIYNAYKIDSIIGAEIE